MRIFLAPLAALSLLATPAAALTVDQVNEKELRGYMATLAEHAGASQWQQLWSNTRQQHHFDTSGRQARFTLPMREIPALVRQTLTAPLQVQILPPTRTQVRRDFSPRVIGVAQDQPLTAICVWLDWRGAPERTDRPLGAADLRYVSLTSAKPC